MLWYTPIPLYLSLTQIQFFFSVVLLDTTKEATLEWTRYPYGPQAQTPGVSTCVILYVFYDTSYI